MSISNILLQVTGSISAYKSVALTSLLVGKGFSVKVILTNSAKNFVGDSSYFGLTKENVIPNTTFTHNYPHPHIDLAKWTDLILIYPASANTINRLFSGLADDLIGATFLANNFHKPYWIAPAMNEQMLIHPVTANSLNKLGEMGIKILYGKSGKLACGDEGRGRLIEPEEIFKEIELL